VVRARQSWVRVRSGQLFQHLRRGFPAGFV
jgi:hypothetical protein